MAWIIVKRKLGRAGGKGEREKRQEQWNKKYGEGLWAIGYVVNDTFMMQEECLDMVYTRVM